MVNWNMQVHVQEQGWEDYLCVYKARLLKEGIAHLTEHRIVVEQGATLSTVLPLLRNFVHQTCFTDANAADVEMFKLLPCCAPDKLNGMQFRFSPQQWVRLVLKEP